MVSLTAKPTAIPMTPAPPNKVPIIASAPKKLNARISPIITNTNLIVWDKSSATKGLGATRFHSDWRRLTQAPNQTTTTNTTMATNSNGKAFMSPRTCCFSWVITGVTLSCTSKVRLILSSTATTSLTRLARLMACSAFFSLGASPVKLTTPSLTVTLTALRPSISEKIPVMRFLISSSSTWLALVSMTVSFSVILPAAGAASTSPSLPSSSTTCSEAPASAALSSITPSSVTNSCSTEASLAAAVSVACFSSEAAWAGKLLTAVITSANMPCFMTSLKGSRFSEGSAITYP